MNQARASSSVVFRAMYTLTAGSGAGRVLGLLSMPILTRIYGPEAFGALGVFVALTMQLAPAMSFRYALALPLPRRDGSALNILILSLGFIALLTTASFLTLSFIAKPLLAWLRAETVLVFWWLIPVAGASIALFELLTLWATRVRLYGAIARTQVLQSAFGEATKILLGLAGLLPLGLILGQIASQIGGSIALLFRFQAAFRTLRRQISRRRLIITAHRYRDFPKFRLPSQLLLGFSAQAPLLFVSALYDVGTAGQFALAMTAIGLPMTLVGRAMGQAYYGEAAALRRDMKELWRMSLSVQMRLLIFAIPTAAAIFIAAEPLFALVFGEEWRQSGRFASILALYLLLQFTSAPLMQALNILEKQRIFLIVNFLRLVGLAVIYRLAADGNWTSENFVWVISAYLSMFYAAMSLYILIVMKKIIRG